MNYDDEVVVVDDERIVLDLACSQLAEMGFQTIHAFECPLEALKNIKNGTIKPVAIITDYFMPGLTGLELLKEAKTILPMSRVLSFPARRTIFPSNRNTGFSTNG